LGGVWFGLGGFCVFWVVWVGGCVGTAGVVWFWDSHAAKGADGPGGEKIKRRGGAIVLLTLQKGEMPTQSSWLGYPSHPATEQMSQMAQGVYHLMESDSHTDNNSAL